ncbi:MAG: Gfo/Idh/MocA family oxidoreductase, partial [Bacteroidales bacterium]|nr:Gfo/Idh/MocA family oxidoreductase [Bacteroidales bacterium]
MFFNLFLLFIITLVGCNENKQYEAIKTHIPERPAGVEDMIAYAAPKIDTVKIGIVGLGMRGIGAVERFAQIPGAEIVALCDIHEDRLEQAQKVLQNNDKAPAVAYSGSEDEWKKLCSQADIDLVYIVTDWQTHADISVLAMENGKHVAVEVPGAMNLKDIWRMIDTSEKTRKHCMMLENCVYDFFELTVLNMIQEGLFGEILHVEGAYIHNLEDFWNYYEADWRMEFNMANRGDLYPTHGMGPVCQ